MFISLKFDSIKFFCWWISIILASRILTFLYSYIYLGEIKAWTGGVWDWTGALKITWGEWEAILEGLIKVVGLLVIVVQFDTISLLGISLTWTGLNGFWTTVLDKF